MQEAKKYHRARHLLLIADIVLSVSFLVLMQLAGISSAIKEWAFSRGSESWVQVFLYMACFFNLFYFVSLPVHAYSSYFLEKKYKLSDQKISRWVLDELKKYALSIFFFTLTMELLYFTVVITGNLWWLVAGIGWLFLTLLLTRIFPTLLLPLFYPTKVLEPGELKERLLALSSRCGVHVMGIYEIALSRKTKKANAALAGLGKSRRILVGDTLKENYTAEEIEMVVAHELGHHVKKHITRSLIFSTLITLLGFYLLHISSSRLVDFFGGESLTDLSIFPALTLLAFLAGFLILPLQNGFSRWQENQADDYALEIFPSRDVFTSLMKKLGSQNLADVEPNPWLEFLLYDHPSIRNRIKHASKILGGAVS